MLLHFIHMKLGIIQSLKAFAIRGTKFKTLSAWTLTQPLKLLEVN